MHGGVGGGGREANPYPDCARMIATCDVFPRLATITRLQYNGEECPITLKIHHIRDWKGHVK